MTACPKCGFKFAWDGTRCAHCNYPDSPLPPKKSADDLVEDRMIRGVSRSKLSNSRTWVFRTIVPEMQDEVRKVADNCIKGRLVLLCVDSLKRWTLLTTREVICWDDANLQTVSFEEMVRVGPATEPENGATGEEVTQWKLSWEYLQVVNVHKKEATVWVPCGSEAFLVWNLLQWRIGAQQWLNLVESGKA